jgi:hypothetical protein
MGKWGLRETLMCIGAVILLCTIIWFVSAKNQRQKDELAQNHTLITQSDKHSDSVQIRTTVARKQSDSVASRYTGVRSKAKIVHDTVTVDSSHVYVDSTLAQIIVSADSTIAAQQITIALQDTLLAAKNVGIGLRDQRIKLLESRGPQRFSKGLQIGVGYCQTANSRTPCIYAGYGFQLRIP